MKNEDVLTFILKWWNIALGLNKAELLYLSPANTSQVIFPSWLRVAAKLTEKHAELSKQSLAQCPTSLTEVETRGGKLR